MFRIPSYSLLVCLAIFPSFATAAPPADPELETGFTSLFNGKHLDGWQTAKMEKAESLEGKTEAFEGRIKVVDGSLVYDPAVNGNRYIETVRKFAGDVRIAFAFNAGEKCNNDVFLRGSKFDIVPGQKETAKVEKGKWHSMEIIVRGDQIEHRINGETVRNSKVKGGASPFMLRAEFGTIQIKDIRFKE